MHKYCHQESIKIYYPYGWSNGTEYQPYDWCNIIWIESKFALFSSLSDNRNNDQSGKNKFCTFCASLEAWTELEPKTSFPILWREGLLCEVDGVDCFMLFTASDLGSSIGETIVEAWSFEGFPSNLLPVPVNGVNFCSSLASVWASWTEILRQIPLRRER